MRYLILTTVFCLLSAVAISQNNKRFSYKSNKEHNTYFIRPIDPPVFKGKGGILRAGDQYLLNLLHKTVNEVFSKEELDLLHKDNKYVIILNSDGEIFYCWFIINADDLKVITEENLSNLYNKFKQTQIDRAKIRIYDENGNDRSFSYAYVLGNFIPVPHDPPGRRYYGPWRSDEERLAPRFSTNRSIPVVPGIGTIHDF